MKVVFVVHGFPPEANGGTERHVAHLADRLAADHEVVVVAGTLAGGPGATERTEERRTADGARYRVVFLARTDLYHDHWQKSASPAVHARLREVVRAERPDVVSVHHWLRLSRDLVLAAAREGVPAALHLHDHWATCPIAFRVKPADGAVCASPANGMVCPPCAGALPPFAPWVAAEEHFIALAERQQDLRRELALARVVTAPSRAHAEAIARFADGALEAEDVRVVAPTVGDAAPCGAESGATIDPSTRAGAASPLVLAHWGSLSRLKGTDLVFEAIDALADPSAVHLRLAGVEERPGFLADLAARFPRVAFEHTGAFDDADGRRAFLAAAHAAVVATRAPESYGLVVDEALAAGLPCALADVRAFRERVADGAGVRYFERGSPAALAALLGEWIEGRRAFADLRAQLASPAPTDVAGTYLAIFADAIAAGPPDPAALPAEDWFTDRIRRHAIEEWDRRLSEHTARELGLEDAR